MGEVIAVVSGKGGTGKTSVCAGIAQALAEAGKQVLCIDCDVGLRNLDISLGLSQGGVLSFLDVAEYGYPLDGAAKHPMFPTLRFLTAPTNRPIEEIDPARFADFVEQLRTDFDFILLDAPAGVDSGFRLVSRTADRVLVVTGVGAAAVRDAARVSQLLELDRKSSVHLIVNRVQKNMLSLVRTTIDDIMDAVGLPLMGIVLEDPDVSMATAFGMPLLGYSRRCEAAKAFRRIAGRLRGEHVPMPMK